MYFEIQSIKLKFKYYHLQYTLRLTNVKKIVNIWYTVVITSFLLALFKHFTKQLKHSSYIVWTLLSCVFINTMGHKIFNLKNNRYSYTCERTTIIYCAVSNSYFRAVYDHSHNKPTSIQYYVP